MKHVLHLITESPVQPKRKLCNDKSYDIKTSNVFKYVNYWPVMVINRCETGTNLRFIGMNMLVIYQLL